MAEIEYSSMNDGAPDFRLPSLGKMVNVAGAVISLGLIAGLGWWGYQLVVRDVSGVPVVRALDGPMRVAPEDPGGQLADHQGLAVNSIPAEGEAQAPADRLVLAPQATQLTDEDTPVATQQVEAPAATVITEPAPSVADTSAVASVASELAEPAPVPNADSGAAAGAEEPGDAAATGQLDAAITAALTAATAEETTAPTLTDTSGRPLVIVPSDLGGVTRSIVPLGRPDNLAALPVLPVGDDGVLSMTPAEIPTGTRLAQLGAFDSRDIAEAEWKRLGAKFPEFISGKARVIEEAQSGGKLFFRLRAHGFDGLADARRFCAAFVAADLNCIPVRQR